ncbi:MAG: hypothetical protein ACJAT2_003763 [Bacteriovoracaceae bacterium]|jgi:hypothetical protein
MKMIIKKACLVSLFLLVSCTHKVRSPSSVKSLLYIGDSQSEGFLGEMIYQHLSPSIKDLNVFGFGSSSPRHWGDEQTTNNSKWLCKRKGRHNLKRSIPIKAFACKGDKSSSAFENLNSAKPDLVVFQFLGNSMGFSEKYIHSKVTKLLEALDDKQECLFITSPPYFKDLVEKNKLRVETQDYFVSAVGNRCKIIKGVSEETLNGYAFERENYLGDRIHLSKKGAAAFFEMIRPSLP